MRFTVVAASLALAGMPLMGQANTLTNPAISAVLDGYYQSADRWESEREEGFGLGHTELALSAAIDNLFYGKVTTVLETHEGETEVNLEEAFVQTLSMPAGFSIRAGRFLADIGYLNPQHLHTDSFVDRPAVYRALLGNHYYDDGVRLEWVAPTDVYWALGAEAFDGGNLEGEAIDDPESVGVYHLYTKFGGDIGTESSWQLGASWLRNENGTQDVTLLEEEHEEEEHEEPGHEEPGHEESEHGHDAEEHGHSHGAEFIGEDLFAVHGVFKWAPDGNYKNNHLSLTGEYFQAQDPYEQSGDDHEGWYVSGVYQFAPQWSAGVRYGEVEVVEFHDHEGEEEFETLEVSEIEAMVAWHPSHFSTLRFQYTNQDADSEEQDFDDHLFSVQFIMTLGAHGAHQY